MSLRRIIAAIAVLGGLVACDDQKASAPSAPPPPEVAFVTVQPQRLTLKTELPGRTAAFKVAEVRPQVSGIILKRLFHEGGEVEAGQQLYQIDPAPYAAALQSARAELARVEATAKAARLKAARYGQLVTGSVVSRQANDDAQASADEAEAAIAVARAAVQSAQINLDYTKVFAPIRGRIGASAVTEGALVTANQTAPLATVTQLDPILVDITQSGAEVMRLRQDIASGTVQGADAATVTLRFDGAQVYPQAGTLQFSEVTVDPTTGSVRLRAQFPNPQGFLLPGLFVRAVVEQAVRENAILVPQQAVGRRPDGSAQVWVIDAENKVAPRPVVAAQAIGDRWLVTEGLAADERVVVQGVQKIKPGVVVRPVPLTPPPAS